MQQFDIVIVGGGMVGGALACALAPTGLSIAVIEHKAPKSFSPEQAMDLRVSAISIASENLLQQIGVWDDVLAMRACPYRFLETWEQSGSNLVFDSETMVRPYLGHIVENRLIQLALWHKLEQLDNVTLFEGYNISQLTHQDDSYFVTLGDNTINTRLLVGADGANSMVRNAANIGVTAWDYAQHAMLINVTTERSQQDITWQQFTPQGPRALLPLTGNKASLVWYDSPARIRQLSQLPLTQLKEQIVNEFPQRLGEFEVDDSGSFSLTRRHAQQYVKPNLCILGDAAHTINPLAGQGVNLGFKDVTALASTISDAVNANECWWQQATLMKYQKARRGDNLLMQSAMDFFYLTFSNEQGPLVLLRNTALKMAEKSTWGKKQVMKYAMGL
ncbi:FAD-dependent monooxygenase [Psychrobium sp. 1_MG-2023]|uniref:FAD-dependent monooxygenase n=1 Tax=Psychrobium sp. 1_MG-2023 TaxID=3062624 RepID=UPI000C3213F5|nr:FAD-dependent monooxygenase [Psychrobium sp. 1_MG-2023]MDP2560953.1 FAD-dependent monooxygenase [Psychrobium sp. 1_MG-2023]PKF56025.1 2-octaprenyl-3-methyl-6-methoxy-1,4-benzoquinol hydroxylase [Alteromonadales bacterium alter-6D02]